MKATYTKLRNGKWGIRVIDGLVLAGSTVVVTKRDGSTKIETVERVLWAGEQNEETVALCSIASTNGRRRVRGGCECDCEDCSGRCRCEPHCNCRGGNVYDC